MPGHALHASVRRAFTHDGKTRIDQCIGRCSVRRRDFPAAGILRIWSPRTGVGFGHLCRAGHGAGLPAIACLQLRLAFIPVAGFRRDLRIIGWRRSCRIGAFGHQVLLRGKWLASSGIDARSGCGMALCRWLAAIAGCRPVVDRRGQIRPARQRGVRCGRPGCCPLAAGDGEDGHTSGCDVPPAWSLLLHVVLHGFEAILLPAPKRREGTGQAQLVLQSQCRPSARCRKAAICARVTAEFGQNLPPPQPWVMPDLLNCSTSLKNGSDVGTSL